MQGGIRRKKDLLPRYKRNRSINNRNGSLLTTPMKKILAYLSLLFLVFLILRVAYSDLNKIPQYELDHSKYYDEDDDDHDANDEVFKEISKDIQKQNDKNIIIDDDNDEVEKIKHKNSDNNIDADGDVRKKISKDKFNNEVAMQQETKNLENDLKPKVDAKDIPKKGSTSPDAHAAPPAAAPAPAAPPALDAAAGALAAAQVDNAAAAQKNLI